MGLNFRKRVSILPGLSLNFGKRGTSVTIGKRGASINIGKNGTYANVGVPGTGISYRERLDKPSKGKQSRTRTNNSNTVMAGSSNSRYTVENGRIVWGKQRKQNNSTFDPNKLNEEQASGGMWVVLAAVYIVAIVFFSLAGNNAYANPGTVIFCYSIGSIALALAGMFTGFSVNAVRKQESNIPNVLMATSLVLTAVAFFIWTSFWPDTADYYKEVWVSKIRKTVELSGWITFGRILAGCSLIAGIGLFFGTSNKTKQSE